MTTLAAKKPNEVKTYTFDFSPRLDEQGITISSINSVTPDSGLTVDSSSLSSDSKKVNVTVSSGTAGTVYKVTAQITLSDGQTWEDDVFIPVRERKD